ncbi:MAG TPA: transcription termination/antitermination NusG family protein [Phenylobacterium sp.]|nr:transcription termination/antitermination NusG family protein [Phenylobacterium sp.]
MKEAEGKQEILKLPLDTARWFVCSTHGMQEKLALENLQRQGFEAYLPLQLVTEKPRGQPPRVVSRPYFPRYIFVRVNMSVCGWRAIYGTRGIVGVLPSGDHASATLARLIEDLKARELEGLLQVAPELAPCPWNAGDKVTYDVFRDVIFHTRVDARRAIILVKMLGRESLKEVDLADLM